MLKQMPSFLEKLFSQHQFGFKKRFSTQQYLLHLSQNWKNAVDKGCCCYTNCSF